MNKYKAVFYLIISAFAFFAIWFNNYRYGVRTNVSWDSWGYYAYLPQNFIEKDIEIKDFSRLEEINKTYNLAPYLYQFNLLPNGNAAIRYTNGMAIFYLPAFFVGHIMALILDYPADGYSKPYIVAWNSYAVLMIVLGLILSRKILKIYFSETVTAIIISILVLGTNFIATTVFSLGMPHLAEFFLYACLFYLTIRWHEKANFSNSFFLGATMGLITLIRPSNIICFLIPMFYNFKGFKVAINMFLVKKRRFFLIMVIATIFICIPQLVYWKLVTEKFFYEGYNNPAEGFDFFSPFILQVFLGFRKGWLIYSPLMILSLTGFYFLYKENKKVFWPVFIFSIVNFYIISSWTCYWYATCFGQRAMVDTYAILAIPMGFTIKNIFSKNFLFKVLVSLLIVLFCGLSLFQTWQYEKGFINYDRMTWKYYQKIFLKTEVSEDSKKYLLLDRYNQDTQTPKDEGDFASQLVYQTDFNQPDKLYNESCKFITEGINKVLVLSPEFRFSPFWERAYKDITPKEYAYYKISFKYKSGLPMTDTKLFLVTTFINKDGVYSYKLNDIQSKNPEYIVNTWAETYFYYLTPEARNPNDKFNAYFWLQGNNEVYIDDLKIELLEPKDLPS